MTALGGAHAPGSLIPHVEALEVEVAQAYRWYCRGVQDGKPDDVLRARWREFAKLNHRANVLTRHLVVGRA